MKTIWFHLMPYPELPEDFTDEHRSVWVDIDPGLFDPVVGHRMYNEYIDELEFAASVGFDGVGINEHHSNAYGLMPSPNLIAAALARTCPDAALVVLGDSVALYNPPIRVADESPYLTAAEGALQRVYGRGPVRIGTGGSIPAVGSIQRILGLESLLVGFGLDDDRVHSPNEKFELECLRRGSLSQAAILHAIAQLRP